MDGDKDLSEKQPLPDSVANAPDNNATANSQGADQNAADNIGQVTPNAAESGVQQSIQFAPAVKPGRTKLDEKEDLSKYYVGPISRRPSIPRVPSEKERARSKREKDAEKRNVDIDEHLLTDEEVAERYKTKINQNKPGDSTGLTAAQAEQLLQEHGPNILTPPKKRHPFLKYLDCLRSLFNLLLILAGILEYILLGVDYKDNFQNVSSAPDM
jgi:sodium/potassium-transporting ATPase subunit alpha